MTAFVLEVVRRFPPVAGFASWDRQTNHHVMVDLRGSHNACASSHVHAFHALAEGCIVCALQVDLFMASLDKAEDGWGATARDFQLRSMAECTVTGSSEPVAASSFSLLLSVLLLLCLTRRGIDSRLRRPPEARRLGRRGGCRRR